MYTQFTKGNETWRLRTKHKKSYLFETPEALWEAACEYFDWANTNPAYMPIIRGREHAELLLPRARPFSMEALCLYMDCGVHYLDQFEARLKDRMDEESEAFRDVITRIRLVIYEQKFTAAATGLLNTRIIMYNLRMLDTKQAAPPEEQKPRSVIVWGEHEIPI